MQKWHKGNRIHWTKNGSAYIQKKSKQTGKLYKKYVTRFVKNKKGGTKTKTTHQHTTEGKTSYIGSSIVMLKNKHGMKKHKTGIILRTNKNKIFFVVRSIKKPYKYASVPIKEKGSSWDLFSSSSSSSSPPLPPPQCIDLWSVQHVNELIWEEKKLDTSTFMTFAKPRKKQGHQDMYLILDISNVTSESDIPLLLKQYITSKGRRDKKYNVHIIVVTKSTSPYKFGEIVYTLNMFIESFQSRHWYFDTPIFIKAQSYVSSKDGQAKYNLVHKVDPKGRKGWNAFSSDKHIAAHELWSLDDLLIKYIAKILFILNNRQHVTIVSADTGYKHLRATQKIKTLYGIPIKVFPLTNNYLIQSKSEFHNAYMDMSDVYIALQQETHIAEEMIQDAKVRKLRFFHLIRK